MWSEGLFAGITKPQRSPSGTARIWLCDSNSFCLNQEGVLYSRIVQGKMHPDVLRAPCIVGIIKYERLIPITRALPVSPGL